MTRPGFLELIGGRWAVSLRVWLLALVLLQIPTFVWTRQQIQGSNLQVLLIGVAGALVMGCVLYLAHRTYLRNRRVVPVSGWLVLATWLIANLVRLVFRAVAVGWLVGGAPPVDARVVVLSTVGVVVWAGLFTYYFALQDYYRGIVADLTDSAMALREAAERQLDDVAALRAELVGSIEDAVLPALRQLSEHLDDLNDDSSAQELLALSDAAEVCSRKIVRDASHEISARRGLPVVPSDRRGFARRAADRELSAHWHLTPSVIGWAALLLAITVIPQGLAGYGPLGARLGIAGFAAWVLILFLLGAAQNSVQAHLRISSLAYVITANLLALIGGIFAMGWEGLFDGGSVRWEDRTAVAALIAFWLTALIAGLLSNSMTRSIGLLQRDSNLLRELNVRIIDLAAEAEANASLLRRQVAETLHGPVQGRLAAVALMLRLNVSDSNQQESIGNKAMFERCRTLLRQAFRDIEAIAQGDSLGERGNVTSLLELLAERWAGLIEVSFRIDPEVSKRVDERPSDRQSVFSIVEESVNNACNHGNARRVSIAIDSDDITNHQDWYRITVNDDGVGLDGVPSAGMGLREIERMGGTWSLVPGRESGACLTVDLPSLDQPDWLLASQWSKGRTANS